MAELQRIEAFVDAFSPLAVRCEATPFNLRSGITSHWYIESNVGLAPGKILDEATALLIESAKAKERRYDVVAGMGMGGRALANAIKVSEGVPGVELNEDESPGQRYGYGLHGAEVENKIVWLVDDVSMSGNSLIKSLGMIRGRGGEVRFASALADRSGGKVAIVLGKLGVEFNTLLTFSERDGLLRPVNG